MGTSDKSIQGGDAVNQTQIQQKIEGPVDRRGSGARLPLQRLEDLVSTDRFMLLPDQLEDLAPDGGKALPLLKADLFGPGYSAVDALLVVMIGIDEA